MTIAVYVVEIYGLLCLFSLSNKWNYPHLNIYLFVIEKQCGLEKKKPTLRYYVKNEVNASILPTEIISGNKKTFCRR